MSLGEIPATHQNLARVVRHVAKIRERPGRGADMFCVRRGSPKSVLHALAILGPLLGAADADAQYTPSNTGSREVLLGTTAGPSQPGISNGPSRPGSAGPRATQSQSQDSQNAAKRLYDDAHEDLTLGQAGSGQRLLEMLIARYPDSEWAERARRDVVELYARSASRPAINGRSTRSALGAPVVSEQPPAPVQPVATAPGTAGGAGWMTSVNRIQRNAQADLIMSAGDRLFFSAGSAELGARARGILAAQAQWLQRVPTAVVVIEGHADEPGGSVENRALGQRRAEAVRQRLIEEGVEPTRVTAISHGRDQRIAVCDGPDCAAQNRRAITVVTSPRVLTMEGRMPGR